MISRLRNRLSRQEGFTLIELLVVIVIIAILAAIAVPAYLGFTSQAQGAAAEADVRSAVPAAEAYFQNNNDSYASMTYSSLLATDAGLAPNSILVVDNASATAYCLKATVSSITYYYAGPGGQPTSSRPGTCS